MEALMVIGLYMGLFIFAINGLILMGLRQERHRIKAYEARLLRNILRRK